MNIDIIREKLAIKIAENLEWTNALDETNPGHYGIHDWEVTLLHTDVFVNIPEKTFNFKNASFYFDLQLGASNEDDGVQMDYTKDATGNGKFSFNGSEIEIEELELEFDKDLAE